MTQSPKISRKSPVNATRSVSTSKMCSANVSGVKMFLLISIFTVLLVFIFIILYRAQRKSIQSIKDQPYSFENFDDKKIKLFFFYMNGCGWCDRFMPIWDEFSNKYSTHPNLQLQKVERSEKLTKRYSEYIAGYPTILIVTNTDKVIVFDGDRTIKGLEAFVYENGINLSKVQSEKEVSINEAKEQAAEKMKTIGDNAGVRKEDLKSSI